MIIEDGVRIGKNCLVGYYTIVRPDVVLGNNTEIRPYCFIAEAARIGSHVKIFQFSNISKLSIIEDCVYIGARVLFTNTHRIAHCRKYEPELRGVHVLYGARIASGAIVMPGVTIGEQALIGAGTVITKDVPAKEVWFGVPATKQGNVPEEEFI